MELVLYHSLIFTRDLAMVIPYEDRWNVILEKQNPMALYPELMQQMPQPEQPQTPGGGASAGSQP